MEQVVLVDSRFVSQCNDCILEFHGHQPIDFYESQKMMMMRKPLEVPD